MKRLKKPGVAVLCAALAVFCAINFKIALRDALGTGYEVLSLFVQFAAPASLIWFLIMVATIGRESSQVLPNGDREVACKLGTRLVVSLVSALLIPLWVYVGFLASDAKPDSWSAVILFGLPSLLFFLWAIAAWHLRLNWNDTQIQYRTLLGRRCFRWQDLQRIEEDGHNFTVNLVFKDKRKLKILVFVEGLEELIPFAESKLNDA